MPSKRPRRSTVPPPTVPSAQGPDSSPPVPSSPEVRTTETEVVVAPLSTVGSRPILTLLSGVNAGQLYAIERAETIIGRARDAGVRLEDVGVSRQHARITRTTAATFVIEDLHSTNGVYLNGKRIDRDALTPGDQVQIGSDVILRFGMIDAAEEALARQLFESSTRDALTGAWNRKYFLGRLASEIAYAERHHTRLSLLMFDLDHFKKVNDTHGHVAGDAVLRNVGLVVGTLLRAEDVFARYGGEEFVVLARGIGEDSVLRLAERVRKSLAATRVRWSHADIKLTVSVGVAHVRENPRVTDTPQALIDRADRRLYQAKEKGRDRVVA
jgi:two-component system, cell cycle response regulator